MADDDADRSAELLRRARELEARTRSDATRGGTSRTVRDALDDLGWLARTVRRLRRFTVETGTLLVEVLRYTGPLWWIVRGVGLGVGRVAFHASHVRVAPDVYELSPKKTARSLMLAVALPVLAYVAYNASTRHRGVFLINDKHLVSGETDEYQMGGCWQREPTQTACHRGEGVIVLIRPTWIPQTGIFSVTYDEDVGVVPLQGRCELATYGIYLRLPWLPFLRGALKPIAVGIGRCEGITGLEAAPAGPRAAVDFEPSPTLTRGQPSSSISARNSAKSASMRNGFFRKRTPGIRVRRSTESAV